MALGSSIKLANLWRVVREVDLQVIREQALMPFELAVVSDDAEMAVRLRRTLSPRGDVSPHPWVRAVDPAGAAAAVTTPDAAIVLSPRPPLDTRLASVVHQFRRARVPVVVAHVTQAPVAASDAQAPDVKGYVVVSSLDGDGVARIATELIAALPDHRRLAFAHQLPPLRQPMFDLTIEETARANATYSLTTGLAEVVPILNAPLNLGDMVILTKNQLLMGYRLALAAGRDGEPRQMITEILGVLGGGMLFRQLARQLVGLIPVAGLIPKVAIAYGGTWAIGRAVELWVTDGRAVTAETVRSLSAEGLERGRRLARELVARASTARGATASRWARLKAQLPGLSRRKGA